MSKPIDVKTMWDDFRARAVPASASANQVRDMRMAFYIGAYDVFSAVVASLDEGEEATEADLALLDNLKAELETGIAEIMASLPGGPTA